MEDDVAFGASVWGAPDDPTHLLSPSRGSQLSQLSPTLPQDSFSDIDGFGEPPQAALVEGDDDDFGDFGDAEESTVVADFVEDIGFMEQARIPVTSTDWEPLKLDPMPSRADLEEQVDDIIGPIWAGDDISSVTTGENVRQVEGASQILITPERYVLLKIQVSFTDTCPVVTYTTYCFSPRQ
jgi:hypothetical protein